MGISYRKLRILLAEYNVAKTELNNIGLCWDTIAKIKHDHYMSLEKLENIARYLSKKLHKKIDIGDIVELKPSDND